MVQQKRCPRCGGSGAVSTRTSLTACQKCGATGQVERGPHEKMSEDQRKALGAGGGAVFGFAAGGPIGAAIGGLLGAALTPGDDDEELTGP